MTEVVLEVGPKKNVFATAVRWPGWCRAGRDEQRALATLLDYLPRYAPVAGRAGLPPPEVGAPDDFVVVERLAGDGTTDFGAPGTVSGWDTMPLAEPEARRRADLVEAAWALLDEVVSGAPPVLRKGPRGGGRDRDQIVVHVRSAQRAYARKIGIRHAEPTDGAADDAADARLRAALLEVLRQPSDGSPPAPKGWPVRYAAARIAWHVLDHAWEIEDKSDTKAVP